MSGDIVARLRSLANALALGEWIELTETCATAAEEIERLRAERDEVRREICDRVSTTRWQPQFPLMTKRQYAEERGWDCFNTNKEN